MFRGASGYTYAEATLSQQLTDWVGVHIRMVEFFGGSSRIWVPDQLKSAITQPCRYEAGVNRTYQDAAEHYGAVVIPARPRKPRDKAKIESTVLVAQRWLLARVRNRTFFSLADLNGAIRELLVELNQRPMQKLRVSRLELYEPLDRPALQPLPEVMFACVLEDGEALAAHVLPRGRDPQIGNGFRGLTMEYVFGCFI